MSGNFVHRKREWLRIVSKSTIDTVRLRCTKFPDIFGLPMVKIGNSIQKMLQRFKRQKWDILVKMEHQFLEHSIVVSWHQLHYFAKFSKPFISITYR